MAWHDVAPNIPHMPIYLMTGSRAFRHEHSYELSYLIRSITITVPDDLAVFRAVLGYGIEKNQPLNTEGYRRH